MVRPERSALDQKLALTAARADELVSRYQNQIRNQVGSINRILKLHPGGNSYDAEMAALHTELAISQRRYDLLLQELRGVRMCDDDLINVNQAIAKAESNASLPDE